MVRLPLNKISSINKVNKFFFRLEQEFQREPTAEEIALSLIHILSMLLGDLSTIVQYKLPVRIVVFNNRSLGMVKLEMEVAGLPDWQTDMENPDFALVAKAVSYTHL